MKLKIKTEKIGEFLSEIVIIVIGVAITLAANNWITNRNAEKDTALYLEAIKLELEENKRALEDANDNLVQNSINYSNYLRLHDKKEMNIDTLIYYWGNVAFNSTPITFKFSAFEMFKTSGNMRLVKNKELLLSLWNTYAELAERKRGLEEMMNLKTEEMKKYFYLNSLPREALLKDPPMYNFYVNMYGAQVHRSMVSRAMYFLDETLSMMEHN